MNAPVRIATPPADGQQEHAEDRSVEERSETVHHFDQRPELDGPDRHHRREHRPEQHRDLRHHQQVRFVAIVADPALVEIHHRRRRQRGELAGDGRHRRRENRRHQQADQPDRHLRDDVGREDVVDVVVAAVARHLLDERNRLRPGVLDALLVAAEGRAPRVDGGRVAARSPHRPVAAPLPGARRSPRCSVAPARRTHRPSRFRARARRGRD